MELGFCIFFGILFSCIANALFRYPVKFTRLVMIGIAGGLLSSLIGVICNFVDIHQFNLPAVLITGLIVLAFNFLSSFFSERKVNNMRIGSENELL